MLWGGMTSIGCKQNPNSSSSADEQEETSTREKRGFMAGSRADNMTVAIESLPKSFAPARADDPFERHVVYNLFEGLVMPASTTREAASPADRVRPGVAQSWEITDEGRTYTFNLRREATWSDGKPIKASDFLYAWKRALDPDREVTNAYVLDVIEGAEAYRRGETEDWNTVGLETPDPYTLVVHLDEPTPHFLEMMTLPVTFPLPRASVQKHGDQWARPEHVQTNGAYDVAEYSPDRGEVLLEARSSYWQSSATDIKEAVFRAISDDTEAIEAYRQGELHWIAGDLSVHAVSEVRDHDDHVREPLLGTVYFQFNPTDGVATHQLEVRRALTRTLSRERIAQNVFDDLVQEAVGLVPPEISNYESFADLEYDVESARTSLEEANLSEKPLELTLLYRHTPDGERLAGAVQEIWHNNLGVDIQPEEVSPENFREALREQNYDIALRSTIAPYADPSAFLAPRHFPLEGWPNREYREIFSELRTVSQIDKRTNLFQESEEYLLGAAIATPVYHPTSHMLVAESLQGLEPHNRGLHLLKDLSFDETAAFDGEDSNGRSSSDDP